MNLAGAEAEERIAQSILLMVETYINTPPGGRLIKKPC